MNINVIKFITQLSFTSLFLLHMDKNNKKFQLISEGTSYLKQTSVAAQVPVRFSNLLNDMITVAGRFTTLLFF